MPPRDLNFVTRLRRYLAIFLQYYRRRKHDEEISWSIYFSLHVDVCVYAFPLELLIFSLLTNSQERKYDVMHIMSNVLGFVVSVPGVFESPWWIQDLNDLVWFHNLPCLSRRLDCCAPCILCCAMILWFLPTENIQGLTVAVQVTSSWN